jgi:GntR family transcriptional regulator
MRRLRIWRIATACIVAALLGLPAAAAAQETTGTITGTATDQTGAVLPGVTVTVTHVQTGRSQEFVTNASGNYTAPLDVADALLLARDSPVFRLRRLRLAEREPMGLQTSFIPLHLAPGIDALEFENASLYEILATRYALHAATARETHRAVRVSREDAALLRVPAVCPARAAARLTRLNDGGPLEYVQSIMRGDRYKIVLDLARPGR